MRANPKSDFLAVSQTESNMNIASVLHTAPQATAPSFAAAINANRFTTRKPDRAPRWIKRLVNPLAPILLATALIGLPRANANPLTITNAFSSARHFGPSPILGPENYALVFGADISPTGDPTTALATQGGVTVPLRFDGSVTAPSRYVGNAPFSVTLADAWSITASRGTETAGSVLTNIIPHHQLLPLVQNLVITGSGVTPSLSWTLPALGDLTVNTNLVSVFSVGQGEVAEFNLNGLHSAFTIPSGILDSQHVYFFTVTLGDYEFPYGLINTSETYTSGFFTVGGSSPSLYQIFATYHNLTGDNALPSADPDHDGLNNATELMLGTDPTDPASAGSGLIGVYSYAGYLHLVFTINPYLSIAVAGVFLELRDGSGGPPFRLTGQAQAGLGGPWVNVLPILVTGSTYRISLPLAGGSTGFVRLRFEAQSTP